MVCKVFAAVDLDPTNADHWFALLLAFIKGSQKRAKAGAPKKWTEDKLTQLLIDFAAQQRKMQQTNPNVSDSSVCVQLARKEAYCDFEPAALRKKLYDARKPERNVIVGVASDWRRRVEKGKIVFLKSPR